MAAFITPVSLAAASLALSATLFIADRSQPGPRMSGPSVGRNLTLQLMLLHTRPTRTQRWPRGKDGIRPNGALPSCRQATCVSPA